MDLVTPCPVQFPVGDIPSSGPISGGEVWAFPLAGGGVPPVQSHVQWGGGLPLVRSYLQWGVYPLSGEGALTFCAVQGPGQYHLVHVRGYPLWTARQGKNITFPHAPCVGGKN